MKTAPRVSEQFTEEVIEKEEPFLCHTYFTEGWCSADSQCELRYHPDPEYAVEKSLEYLSHNTAAGQTMTTSCTKYASFDTLKTVTNQDAEHLYIAIAAFGPIHKLI